MYRRLLGWAHEVYHFSDQDADSVWELTPTWAAEERRVDTDALRPRASDDPLEPGQPMATDHELPAE